MKNYSSYLLSNAIYTGKFFVFLAIILIFSSCQKQVEKSTPPNVILIITDDQGYGDLGSHGNPYIKTPNLDQFATESVECTNFHVGTTCSPTRAGLMSGRNANRVGAWHTIAGCSILNAREETMADVFKRNGYGTAMFGKWHLGDSYPFRPHDRGFDETFYHGGGGVIQTPDYWLNDYFDDTYFRNGTPEKTEGYCTDVWFEEAMKFIESKKDQPFFVYLATNAAHGPFNVAQKYMDMYKDAPLLPIQQRFNGMITNLDENFGKLAQRLEDLEIADNTILIFMTDNGTAGGIRTDRETQETYGYNAGLRGIKGSHYDGGHMVPFFIRWPNGELSGGKKTAELMAHVDMLPTLANLCGLDYAPKRTMDGIDVSEVLKGAPSPSRMLITDTQRNQWPEKGRRSCVMDGPWRLVDGKELYNTADDPGQENDIAAQHQERVASMQKFYDEWWASAEKDFYYSHFPLGNEHANPTSFTIHDIHSTQGIAWNQRQIRAGNVKNPGYYSIDVQKAGTYEFTLSRWPLESGLAFNESAPEVEATESIDGYAEGNVLDIKKATVNVGDAQAEADVDQTQPSVVVQIDLPAGKAELRTNFIDGDGNEVPVYYQSVRLLK